MDLMANTPKAPTAVSPSPPVSFERPAVLLVNTHSRTGKACFREASSALAELGIELVRAVECDRFPTMVEEAHRAVKEQVPVLIGGGGDGTVNALANIVIGSKTALGVLPLGTGNAFARDLGIPFEVKAACEALTGGKRVAVDVGEANAKLFLNVASIGLTGGIVRSLTESLKRKYGRAAYVYAVVRAIRQIQPFRVELKTENGKTSFESLQVVIGNGRYHAGPFPIAPNAGITTRKLSLYALESASKVSLLKLALHLPGGDHVLLPEIHSEATVGGHLVTVPPRRGIFDGELGPPTPFHFSVKPRSLEVIAPQEFEG